MINKNLPVAVAGVWIVGSEFARNEFFLKHFWEDHFSSIGLVFETKPINGVLWMVWSFVMAYLIFRLLQKFSFKETVILVWLASFLMMWIVVYNLQTLPLNILWFAVPLSIVEIVVAGVIIQKLSNKND